MSLRLVSLTLVTTALLVSGAEMRAYAEPDHASDGDRFWQALRSHEVSALEDVEQHRLGAHVLDRADALYRLSTEIEGRGRDEACGRAARTLSFMVRGFVETSRRLEISQEWTHFAPRYIDEREACLAALHVEAARFPLPTGFER